MSGDKEVGVEEVCKEEIYCEDVYATQGPGGHLVRKTHSPWRGRVHAPLRILDLGACGTRETALRS